MSHTEGETPMTEQIDKAELLANMQAGYNTFEALLAGLNETQMTTPGVNGVWSVKDNLAHLSAWHLRQLALLQGVRQGKEPDLRLVPDSSVDEINEQVFEENKNRPLAEILATFRSSYQHVSAEVQAMTDEELNKPISWLNDRPIWLWVAGNTYEHYEEHSGFIRNWLASQ
jgi:hypothetical protein